MAAFTKSNLSKLEPGQSLSFNQGTRGHGRLVAEAGIGGIKFVYRYTDKGRRREVTIGPYNPDKRVDGPVAGLTITEAQAKAGELMRAHAAGDTAIGDVMAERKAANAEAQAQRRQRATFGELLTAYAQALTGKASQAEVLADMNRIKNQAPALWAMAAADVTPAKLAPAFSSMAAKGQNTAIRKRRAAIRAAYSAALRASQSPHGDAALRACHITTHPLRDWAAPAGGTGTRDAVLTETELAAYYAALCGLNSAAGLFLRCQVRLGGQRFKQLLRCQESDLDSENKLIRLLDSKGRRDTPRAHWLPVPADMWTELMASRQYAQGPWLFSHTLGENPAHESGMTKAYRETVKALHESGKLSRLYVPADIRRTVETVLAANGRTTAEVRAQIQSHGLGGVQSRHYNRHDYLAEKTQALAILGRLMGAC